jgi:hypothetical protein
MRVIPLNPFSSFLLVLYDVRVKVLLLKIVLTYSMWLIYIFCRPAAAPLIYKGVLNADVTSGV